MAVDSAVGYLVLFFGSVVFGGVALMLGGVAAHHGLLWVPGVLLVGLVATWLRARIVARRRHIRLSWFGLARASVQMVLLVALGYALAHVLHTVPDAVRILLGFSAALLLGAGAIQAVNSRQTAGGAVSVPDVRVESTTAPKSAKASTSDAQTAQHSEEARPEEADDEARDSASTLSESAEDGARSNDEPSNDEPSDDEANDTVSNDDDSDDDSDDDLEADAESSGDAGKVAAMPPPALTKRPASRLERGLNWAVAHPWTLSALIVMTLIPWWRPPTQTLRELVALELQAQGLEAKLDTLHWVDEPFDGMRTGPKSTTLALDLA